MFETAREVLIDPCKVRRWLRRQTDAEIRALLGSSAILRYLIECEAVRRDL